MTARRPDRKAQMAAVLGSRTEPDAAPAGHTAIRTQPARVTLNLPPELYRQLNRWCDSAADTIDVPRVGVQEAMRAMIRVLTGDEAPTCSARVIAELRMQLR